MKYWTANEPCIVEQTCLGQSNVISQQTQNICITFRPIQRRHNVFDVGLLYEFYTNVLCLLGYYIADILFCDVSVERTANLTYSQIVKVMSLLIAWLTFRLPESNTWCRKPEQQCRCSRIDWPWSLPPDWPRSTSTAASFATCRLPFIWYCSKNKVYGHNYNEDPKPTLQQSEAIIII